MNFRHWTIGYFLRSALGVFLVTGSALSASAIGCGGYRPDPLIKELNGALNQMGQGSPSRAAIRCNDSGFTDWRTLGSQNLPVLSTTIGLYRSPNAFITDVPKKGPDQISTITYLDWWIVYLALQTGQIVPTGLGVHEPPSKEDAPNLRYFKGTEFFSNKYDAAVVTAVIAVRFWAYSSYANNPNNINAQKLQLLKNYSLAYLRANWFIYAAAAGSGPAREFAVPGRTPKAAGQVPTANLHFDPWANHSGNVPQGSLKFGGRYLALAGTRSDIGHTAADDKNDLFDRAMGFVGTKRNESGSEQKFLDALVAAWPSTSHPAAESLYGLIAADRAKLVDLTNDTNALENVQYFMPWLNGIHLGATYRIIGWQGYRASSMDMNREGANNFAILYSLAEQKVTFLFPWIDGNDAGNANGLCVLSPTRITADNRPVQPPVEVFFDLPTDRPVLFHLVLSGSDAKLDFTPQANWPNFTKLLPGYPGSTFNNATEITWVLNTLPNGAFTGADGDDPNWKWIDSSSDALTPMSLLAHQSNLLTGMHQHYFMGATSTLTINTGDLLYAYVYLDPVNPPHEVMMQWYDSATGWEHRAFWGQDLWTTYGAADTSSRRYIGPLPPTGEWTLLQVPANVVGLEGHTLTGMAFTLVDGQATWDEAGKSNEGTTPINLALNKPASQSSVAFGGVAGNALDGNTNGNASYTHTNNDFHAWWQVDLGDIYLINQLNLWNRTDCCSDRLSNFYVFVSDDPFTSTDLNTTLNQTDVSAYYFAGTVKSPSKIAIVRPGRYVRVQLAGTNYLSISEAEVIGPSVAPSMPPPATPPAPYEGFHEGVDCNSISGWVWLPSSPSTRLNVSVFDDTTGNQIASGTANLPRSDLGRGDGQYGFSIPTPDSIKNGATHVVRVRVTGTNFDLALTPRNFNSASAGCSAPPPPPPNYDGFHETIDCNNVGGWVWDQNNPTARLNVSVIDDNTGLQIASGVADQFRQDLVNAGKGDGRHGFGIAIPGLNNGQLHNVRVKVTGTNFSLIPKGYNSSIAGCALPPASDFIWVEDNVPPAGTVSDNWNWVYSNPPPLSGIKSHQSGSFSGGQQHFFFGANTPLQINPGDKLMTYVYLDPANPPSEIMLQWYDASSPPAKAWEHRAYWGANLIAWGDEGTEGRRYMGALPPTGLWVRLEVPASQLGVEGHMLTGMAFSQSNGTVTWDHSGKNTQSFPSPPPPGDNVWVEDDLPPGAVGVGEDGWNWVVLNPGPLSGVKSSQSIVASGPHQHYFYGASSPLTVNAGDKLIAYVYLDPFSPPTEVVLQWNDGSWDHRAYWGADNITNWGTGNGPAHCYMGSLPAAGQWIRLEVPASSVGLVGHQLNGVAFTLYGGRATWDHAGKISP
ncbi:MAG TPA: discoidin domain-containing protein [Pyrinomonadaceae bacterium]|nr:discoidin domain-containing protein [Pyrinomonadaceae bacterium]